MPTKHSPHGERVAYYNGEIVPECEVKLPFHDRGFKYGDAVFDMTRTFGHRIFRLEEHIHRLYDSLRYVQIDPGISAAEMIAKSEKVLAANLHLLGPDDDYWVGQRVTRGVDVFEGDAQSSLNGPNLIIECTPLPFQARARLFRDGIDVVIPSVRRVPPESLSPRVKSHNYLNLVIADLEAKAQMPEAWAILLDTRGFFAEGMGSNIFVVKNGTLFTPKPQYVLGGISRQTVIELAQSRNLVVREQDLDLYDAYTADEVFLTSTSLCVCGVRSIQGNTIGDGSGRGRVTAEIMESYVELVNHDWIAQYLKRLPQQRP